MSDLFFMLKTTDPQDELFDIVDDEDRVIGQATRRDVHADKRLLHRSVTVLVLRDGKLFLQKRSSTKDTYPGCWTASCSGHLDLGENYECAARRELREELGIHSPVNVRRMFRQIIRYPGETEMMSVFRCEIDEDLTLNMEEIEEGRFFTMNDAFFRNVLPSMKTTPHLEFVIRSLGKFE